MVPTLARNLDYMQPTNLLIIDEAHHTAAKSYQAIVDRAKALNPDVMIAGFTATAQRGDKAPLRKTFDNVADQISLSEMIQAGILVKPRTFVIDVGVQDDLREVRKLSTDYDMTEVAKIMGQDPVIDRIVSEWKAHANGRRTVGFCSTVEHARKMNDAFLRAGILSSIIWGDMPRDQREKTLDLFDKGIVDVLFNVAVLTEGWDCQPVDCIMLLRPSSYKSTMIQMIGRGLRKVDPERHPGVVKNDCLVLDFGTSILIHGSLEMEPDLDPSKGEAPERECPECEGIIPLNSKVCPLCGAELEEDKGDIEALPGEKVALEDFIMREIDILDASPFKWETFWDGAVMIANGFDAYGMVIWYQGEYHAVCGARGIGVKHLMRGEKLLCLSSADDFIRLNEQENSAHKSRRWLHLPPTAKQLQILQIERGLDINLNRYRASCLLSWKFNEDKVQAKLQAGRTAA
jgi:rRNA maturation endonuclease Nob1